MFSPNRTSALSSSSQSLKEHVSATSSFGLDVAVRLEVSTSANLPGLLDLTLPLAPPDWSASQKHLHSVRDARIEKDLRKKALMVSSFLRGAMSFNNQDARSPSIGNPLPGVLICKTPPGQS